jgi:hypothetical protein
MQFLVDFSVVLGVFLMEVFVNLITKDMNHRQRMEMEFSLNRAKRSLITEEHVYNLI